MLRVRSWYWSYFDGKERVNNLWRSHIKQFVTCQKWFVSFLVFQWYVHGVFQHWDDFTVQRDDYFVYEKRFRDELVIRVGGFDGVWALIKLFGYLLIICMW